MQTGMIHIHKKPLHLRTFPLSIPSTGFQPLRLNHNSESYTDLRIYDDIHNTASGYECCLWYRPPYGNDYGDFEQTILRINNDNIDTYLKYSSNESSNTFIIKHIYKENDNDNVKWEYTTHDLQINEVKLPLEVIIQFPSMVSSFGRFPKPILIINNVQLHLLSNSNSYIFPVPYMIYVGEGLCNHAAIDGVRVYKLGYESKVLDKFISASDNTMWPTDNNNNNTNYIELNTCLQSTLNRGFIHTNEIITDSSISNSSLIINASDVPDMRTPGTFSLKYSVKDKDYSYHNTSFVMRNITVMQPKFIISNDIIEWTPDNDMQHFWNLIQPIYYDAYNVDGVSVDYNAPYTHIDGLSELMHDLTPGIYNINILYKPYQYNYSYFTCKAKIIKPNIKIQFKPDEINENIISIQNGYNNENMLIYYTVSNASTGYNVMRSISVQMNVQTITIDTTELCVNDVITLVHNDNSPHVTYVVFGNNYKLVKTISNHRNILLRNIVVSDTFKLVFLDNVFNFNQLLRISGYRRYDDPIIWYIHQSDTYHLCDMEEEHCNNFDYAKINQDDIIKNFYETSFYTSHNQTVVKLKFKTLSDSNFDNNGNGRITIDSETIASDITFDTTGNEIDYYYDFNLTAGRHIIKIFTNSEIKLGYFRFGNTKLLEMRPTKTGNTYTLNLSNNGGSNGLDVYSVLITKITTVENIQLDSFILLNNRFITISLSNSLDTSLLNNIDVHTWMTKKIYVTSSLHDESLIVDFYIFNINYPVNTNDVVVKVIGRKQIKLFDTQDDNEYDTHDKFLNLFNNVGNSSGETNEVTFTPIPLSSIDRFRVTPAIRFKNRMVDKYMGTSSISTVRFEGKDSSNTTGHFIYSVSNDIASSN